MNWFFRDQRNFVTFSTMLLQKSLPNHFYSSDLIKYILNQFWDRAQIEIVKKQFLPYVCYTTATVFYFHQQLRQDEQEFPEEWTVEDGFTKLLGGLILLYTPFAVGTDILQLKYVKPVKYFSNLWNWVDIAGVTITTMITL